MSTTPNTDDRSEARRPYAIYAITQHGLAIARRLREGLGESDADLFVSKRLEEQRRESEDTLTLPMGPTLQRTFCAYDAHIFVISVGAVVRMIAPLMKDKHVDPAVICVDDAARFAICTLSGHVGRGNEFTERVASVIQARPVITTASDVRGTLTVDILGRDLGWTLDDPDRNVTLGCAAVVNERPVAFVQESGEPDFWPADRALPQGVQYFTDLDEVDPTLFEMLLICSDRDLAKTHPDHFAKAVVYRPKTLVLGLGCDRDTPPEVLSRGVDAALQEAGLTERSIREIATIDKKADEPAILDLAEARGWSLITYTAEELDRVEGIENPSEVVRKHVGTRSVAEAACLKAAGASRLLVAKRAYTESKEGHNMTASIARVPFATRSAAALTKLEVTP